MRISRKLEANFRMKILDRLVKQVEKCIHLRSAKAKVNGKNIK
jgi:hypothetical protein